jgi:hypothetical protein
MTDPHWNYRIECFPPDERTWWENLKKENDEAYTKLAETGIDFRGWKFWPPFFCMSCGRPINTNQWLFARICGGCDTGRAARISMLEKVNFAGRVEKLPSVDGDRCIVKQFIDPRTPEGKLKADRMRELLKPRPHPLMPWLNTPRPKRGEEQ